MKSKYQIKMNFQQAKAEAARVERVADQMKTLGDKRMEQSMRNLSYAWTGHSARRFLDRQRFQLTHIRTITEQLYEIAADIRTVAAQVYEAEMRAYEIAARRSSGGNFGGGGGGGRW